MNAKKENVILAKLAWNPYGWEKTYRDVREGIGGAAHEALNFDFEKNGIDKDGFIYGYVRWGGKGTPKKRFCDSGIIIFYTTDPDTNKKYIVGIYGKAQIIVPDKIYSRTGFWKNEYWTNVCAEKRYSMRFRIPLDAERYKNVGKGLPVRFFNYQDVAFAKKIISDELKELNKKGGYRNDVIKLKDILKSDELFLDAGTLAMNNDAISTIDESIINEEIYTEGGTTETTKEVIKRNRVARKKCLAYCFKNNEHYKCKICGFDFEEKYGKIGKHIIDVHHIKSHAQVSKEIGEHEIDPETGLIPICSNCHRIIHRQKPPLEINEVRNLIKAAKKRCLN
jgi:hypothetical protein